MAKYGILLKKQWDWEKIERESEIYKDVSILDFNPDNRVLEVEMSEQKHDELKFICEKGLSGIMEHFETQVTCHKCGEKKPSLYLLCGGNISSSL
ncbi:MAG: hypothetical protein ABIH72_01795 [archaeon]